MPDIPDKTPKNNNNLPQLLSSKLIPRIAHEAVVDIQSVEEKVQIGNHCYNQGEHPEEGGGLEVHNLEDQADGEVEDHDLVEGVEDCPYFSHQVCEPAFLLQF